MATNNDEISASIPNTDELNDTSSVIAEVIDVQILVEQMKPYMGGKFVQDVHGLPYPKVEWWNQLGAFVGVKPVVEYDKRLDSSSARHSRDGEITYEAGIQLRSIDGRNILHGRGISMCSSQEKRWANTDEFAIRSMSQTRATGKAYRLGYSNVALACGIEATPAEEMMDIEKPFTKREYTSPPASQKLTHTTVSAEDADGSYVIDFGQWKDIRPNGITLDEIYVFDEYVPIKKRQISGVNYLEYMSTPQPGRPFSPLQALCKKFLEQKRGMVQEAKQTSLPNTKNSMPDNVRQMLSQLEQNPGSWRKVAGELIGTEKSLYDYTQEDFDNLSTELTRKLEGASQGEMNV